MRYYSLSSENSELVSSEVGSSDSFTLLKFNWFSSSDLKLVSSINVLISSSVSTSSFLFKSVSWISSSSDRVAVWYS